MNFKDLYSMWVQPIVGGPGTFPTPFTQFICKVNGNC